MTFDLFLAYGNSRPSQARYHFNRDNKSLLSPPFTRAFNEYSQNSFTSAQETIRYRITTTGAAIETDLANLRHFFDVLNVSKRDNSIVVYLTAAYNNTVGSGNTLDGYVAKVNDMRLILPDNESLYNTINGISPIELEVDRSPWYSHETYLMFREGTAASPIYQNIGVANTSTPLFTTIDSPDMPNNPGNGSLLHYSVAFSGLGSSISDQFFVVTSAYFDRQQGFRPYLVTVNSTTGNVSDGTAVNGRYNRMNASSPTSFVREFVSSTFYDISNLDVFASMRVVGDWRVSLGEGTGGGVPQSTPVYLEKFANPTFQFIGRLDNFRSSSLGFFADLLLGSGTLDVNMIAIIPRNAQSAPNVTKFVRSNSIANQTSFQARNLPLGALNVYSSIQNNTFAGSNEYVLANSPLVPITGTLINNPVVHYPIGDIGHYFSTGLESFIRSDTNDNTLNVMILATSNTISGWLGPRCTATFAVTKAFPYLPKVT